MKKIKSRVGIEAARLHSDTVPLRQEGLNATIKFNIRQQLLIKAIVAQ